MSIKYLDNNGLATLWSKIKALITTASIADIGSPSSYNNITNIRVANEINKGLWIDLGERIINTSNNSIDFTASCFLFDPITQTQTEVDFNQLFQSSEILPPIYLIGSGDLIFETAAEAIYNIRININNSGYKYLTGLPTNRRASAAVDPLGSQYLKYENFGETGGEYRLFNNTLYKLKKTNIRIDGWYEDCWGITEMLFSPNILESYYTPLSDGIASVGYSTNYARADHIHPSDTSRAPIASPQFTGTPTAPTASTVVNNTQLATTQFVHNLMSTIPTYSVATTATDGLMSSNHVETLNGLTGDVDNLYTAIDALPTGYFTEVSFIDESQSYTNPAPAINSGIQFEFLAPLYIDGHTSGTTSIRQQIGINAATTAAAGVMSAQDKIKLDSALRGIKILSTDFSVSPIGSSTTAFVVNHGLGINEFTESVLVSTATAGVYNRAVLGNDNIIGVNESDLIHYSITNITDNSFNIYFDTAPSSFKILLNVNYSSLDFINGDNISYGGGN